MCLLSTDARCAGTIWKNHCDYNGFAMWCDAVDSSNKRLSKNCPWENFVKSHWCNKNQIKIITFYGKWKHSIEFFQFKIARIGHSIDSIHCVACWFVCSHCVSLKYLWKMQERWAAFNDMHDIYNIVKTVYSVYTIDKPKLIHNRFKSFGVSECQE